MLCLRPTDAEIREFLARQGRCSFTYDEVGATRSRPPGDAAVDHNRIVLGHGAAVFERAVAAMRRWQMFDMPGVRLCWPNAAIEPGTTVAILAGLHPVWALNACRIVYVVDEPGPPRRFGFAYGTLPAHPVRGEERFLLEWDTGTGEVAYDLLAFSRPGSRLAALARPLLRRAQRRFARLSKQAMLRAVEPAGSKP